MASRKMTGKRLSNNTSLPNRKVAPAGSDVSIHSFGIDDQKVCRIKCFIARTFYNALVENSFLNQLCLRASYRRVSNRINLRQGFVRLAIMIMLKR